MSVQIQNRNRDGQPQRPITILIADDHPLFREALRSLLETDPGVRVIGEAADGSEAVRLAHDLRPDLVLLDLVMPGGSGFDALRELTATTSARVLLLTAEARNNDVLEALTLGARGVVPKHSATRLLFKSIRTVMAGGHWVGRECLDEVIDRMRRRVAMTAPPRRPTFGLSARELQVVASIVAGRTNEDVASALRISVKTVKHHLTSIFGKLGITNRLELALFAVQRRIVEEPTSPSAASAAERATLVA